MRGSSLRVIEELKCWSAFQRERAWHNYIAFQKGMLRLQQPDSLVSPCVGDSLLVHATIKETQTKRDQCSRKATRCTREVSCRISIFLLFRNPDPLGNDLAHTSTTVVERGCDAHGDDRWNVTSHPCAQRTRAREGSTSTEEEAPVACSVGVSWQETSCEPANATNGGACGDMPTASIEVVCTPAEEQTDKVAADPWRHYEGG